MKSKFEVDNMNIAWKQHGAFGCKCFSGMPSGKCLNSKNSRRAYNRMLKNKWRKVVDFITKKEIEQL